VTASCRWRSTLTLHSTQVSASLLFQCGRCSDIILFSSWDKLWI
jgi:hypothetical protein